MLNKLKYGFERLVEEFLGKEDYWHIQFYPIPMKEVIHNNRYYLDVAAKSNYPFEKLNGIPLVAINDRKCYFVITILLYGLGLIDQYLISNKEICKKDILTVYDWLISNQTPEGAWEIFFEDSTYGLKSGWVSGMAQGLALSFLIRCSKLGFVDERKSVVIIELTKEFMLSSRILNLTKTGRIIEEYEGTNTNVLNGFIFALYGLYDYGLFVNDMSLFNEFEKTLCSNLENYRILLWSTYDSKHTISSRYYHNLHINMMKSLSDITNKTIYLRYAKVWKLGDKIFPIFVVSKGIQKLFALNKIDTLDK
ncbi:MAG: D-glucuronyl C5-epimerase family protein [Marinifilaceae bacterium]